MNSDVKHLKNVTKYIARGITPSYDEKGVCVINQRCVRDKSVRLNDARITNPDKKKINEEKFLKKFDVLVNSTGVGTLGRVAQIKNDLKKPLTADSHVTIVRPDLKIIDGLYFGYAMMNAEPHITFLGEGSTGQIELSRKRLASEIEINVPEIFVQKRIAAILSSIDEKIKLNQEMNQTLEQIGQAIFRHWFVSFEFPDSDGRPYKSSGGKMVDSEFGEIPKGWKIGKLKDVGKIVCGKTPPKSKQEYFGGEVPFIKIPDMHGQTFVVKTEDSLTQEGKKFQQNKTLPANSVCISCIATVGLVCITPQDSQTNQQINSLIPQYEFFTPYLYYKMSSMKDFIEILASGGSATLNLNTKNFSNIDIIIPSNEVLKKYYKIVKLLFDHILNNQIQNETLSQLRDSLLPKLMSGKIRVNIPEEATAK